VTSNTTLILSDFIEEKQFKLNSYLIYLLSIIDIHVKNETRVW